MNQLKYQFRYYLPVWFLLLITGWLPDNKFSIRIRGFLVAPFLPGHPKKLELGRDVTLLGINNLIIGDNVYLAKGTWINGKGKVVIEDEVIIAPYVIVVSTSHGFQDGSVRYGGTHFAPVLISKGTWVAAHCTIASGTTIGSGCMIGANSFVSGNFGSNLFIGGVPAKVIKNRVDNPGIL